MKLSDNTAELLLGFLQEFQSLFYYYIDGVSDEDVDADEIYTEVYDCVKNESDDDFDDILLALNKLTKDNTV